MNKKLEILLVEDDTYTCREFSEAVANSDDMILIGITNNATKALTYIKDYQPHAIILDLELHEGSGNGLQVLQELPMLALERRPYVLITTNNSSSTTYDIARKLGADFIMSKHQPDYSVKGVLEFLHMISDVIKTSPYTSGEIHSNTTETKEQHHKRITRSIMTELNLIGINQKSVGYQYLVDSILIMYEQQTHHICEFIAQRYHKTEASVKRAMQNSIERAWRNTDIEDLLRYYTAKINSTKGNPTVTEFVCYYANKLKNEY